MLKLQAIVEFSNFSIMLKETEGFLNPVEGYALMELAANGHGVGEILEVGSYMGLSASWLALGSMRTHREKVTAVDHFKGSPEHQAGQPCETQALAEGGSTFPMFQGNLRRIGVQEHVTPVIASSAEAVRDWKKPIRLLFIDGEHSYEATRLDYEIWSPFVVPGGYVCFHDVGNSPGVTQFCERVVKQNECFSHVVSVASLAIFQKRI